jgi:hypothetical protein
VNYFAHGHALVDDPWALAGTALPDWLGASDRGCRLRRERIVINGDPRAAALARGILRHLDDDSWFHATEAFQRTESAMRTLLRDAQGAAPHPRTWFFAHVLVEMLLDRFLIQRDPVRLDAYYGAVDAIDAAALPGMIDAWTVGEPDRLPEYVEAFREWRYLYGYLEDDALFRRLGGLARRVGLDPLPSDVRAVLPEAAALVEARVDDLMRAP